MKKSLLLLVFLSASYFLQAQCTITPGCSTTSTGYCSTPASGSSLPAATEQVAYNTTIQLSLGTAIGPATINNATITSVTGLPTGLTAAYNPSNGIVTAGTSACILVSGTPAAATAGNYTMTANISVSTNFGASPQTLTWTLVVNAVTGIASFTASSSTMTIMPNPASSSITVLSGTENIIVHITDILGKDLLQTTLQQGKGNIDISSFAPGVYFLRTNRGAQRFIKQ